MRCPDALALLVLLVAVGCASPTIVVQCPAPPPVTITDPGPDTGPTQFDWPEIDPGSVIDGGLEDCNSHIRDSDGRIIGSTLLWCGDPDWSITVPE